MKSNKILLLPLILMLVTNCGGGGSGGGSGSSSGSGNGVGVLPTGNNVLSLTVNGSLCSSNPADNYINEPCVSVTVCSPGTSNCQTINNILLDTGDVGLRVFKQVLTVPLTAVTEGANPIAECIAYADNSSNWGPVETADVVLGNEPAVSVPIQVIDSAFETVPSACTGPNDNPTDAGFNGSLGLGLFLQDCGPACASTTNNPNWYYSCNGSACTQTMVALADQVQNPVALLPEDNNGAIVELPSISSSGALSVNGALVLGIGTQSNNTPSGVTAYDADAVGDFITEFNGVAYPQSFIDSGSNGLFFPPPSASTLPTCTSDSDWFCPSSTKTLSATNIGASGSPSGTVSFQIGNFDSLLNSPNNVFADIGGPNPGEFDWGLPFFFGRKVYIGIEGLKSGLGTGPYWAY